MTNRRPQKQATPAERFSIALKTWGIRVSALAMKLGCSRRVVYKWTHDGPSIEVLDFVEREATRWSALPPPGVEITRGRPTNNSYVDNVP